jgi:NTE family protein
LLTAGCAGVYKPVNQSIAAIDETTGYRAFTGTRRPYGENLVLLAFSGGGTRAAVLSYGVMQELRDTTIAGSDHRLRLLDDVDMISSVSGGSFTAAYYGVFGEKLFTDYEQDFLRQSVQSNLIKRLLSPGHWFKSLFSAFDRTEMAIDVYDRMVFKGATFADIPLDERPFIEINATDLAAGLRFSFTQERFDLLCSDLSKFSIARAVTASSAVPVAFPSVVLRNHADDCDISQSREWQLLTNAQINSARQERFVEGLQSYRDADNRPFVHLVDGGISDNLGLRATLERIETLQQQLFERLSENPPRSILIILVNAEVKPKRVIEKTANKPSIGATVSAMSNAQISRYNLETRDDLRRQVENFQTLAEQNGLPTKIYYAEVQFNDVPITEASTFLNNLPTSLELDGEDIDKLIATARILLRREPEFVKFLQHNDGRRSANAFSDQKICEYFDSDLCR